MKILLYSDYYKKKSGYAREINDLLPYFKKAGHQIAHVALGYNGYPLNDDEDIRVYPTNLKEEKKYWAPSILDYAIEDFKPDVVFTRQDFFVLPEIAFCLSKPRNFKWVHWGLADGEPLGKRLDEPMKWVHQHIFTTEFTKAVVQAQNKDIQGEIVYPPINPLLWNKKLNKDELRKKYDIKNKHIIVSVARNQPRKNIPCLLESIKILVEKYKEDVMLILVAHDTKLPGGGDAGYDIEHLIKYYGVENNVLSPGRFDKKILEDNAVAEMYAIGDVFALPTMGEGFGLIFGEAMYAGLPIVATDYSACSEVVKGRGNLVKPVSYVWDVDNVKQAVVTPEDFALAIRGTFEENVLSEQWNEWQDSMKKFVEEITPKNQAKKLLKIMEETIKQDKKPLALV